MKHFLALLILIATSLGLKAQDTTRLLSYPYEWDDATCQTDFHAFSSWFGGWYFDATTHSFYQSGKGTNWIGSLTTDTFDFPADETVSCHFQYGTAGGAVTLKVLVDYGENVADTITLRLAESPNDFSNELFSFHAKGPARLFFSATLANPLDYGSFYIRRICLRQAQPDLAITRLLAPAASQLGASSAPVGVSVHCRNLSPFALTNPVLGYDAGQGKVEETLEATIQPNETFDYTFHTAYTHPLAGTSPLRVWCHVEGDANPLNDSLRQTITYYQPQSFPYSTDFSDPQDQWMATEGTWQYPTIGNDNTVACCQRGGTLLSPAITMPAGTARVSFYYAAVNRSGARLRLLMGRGTGPAELTEVLFDQPVGNDGWLNGYHLLNIPEAGVYYFALQYDEASDYLLIDNFRVDAEEDLCMHGVEFDCQSGFALSTARVTLSFVNHGVTPQSNIALRYYVNNLQHYADEVAAGPVMPGDTLRHTFQLPVDISATDSTYTLYGQLLTPVGSDTQNDLMQGQTLHNYRPFSVPYACNFMDDSRYNLWLAVPSNGNLWYMANNFYAYDGNIDLQHTNTPAEGFGTSDDWAYSEALQLSPGQYEVAFFHRGRTYFSGPDYVQSFAVAMGTDRNPQSMTMPLARFDSLDYGGSMHYRRHVARVNIDREGLYYLGFHNYSQPNRGETHIDAITVAPVESGLPLPYASHFSTDADGWMPYAANSASSFVKWQLADGAMQAQLSGSGYAEGPLVSPKLALQPERNVLVTVDYDLEAEADTMALCLYTAPLNTPQAFTLLATAPATQHTFTAQFTTPSTPSDCYVALRTNSDLAATDRLSGNYQLRINAVQVAYDVDEGLTAPAVVPSVSIARTADAITIRASQPIQRIDVLDAAGRPLAIQHPAGATRATLSLSTGHTVVMVRITTSTGVVTRKLCL